MSYSALMSFLVEMGDGKTSRTDGQVWVEHPGVLLLAASSESISGLMPRDDISCTFLFSGITTETLLELLAHSEATVARLTTSRTTAMNAPLMVLDTHVDKEFQKHLLTKLQQARDHFENTYHPREVTGSTEEKKTQIEWFNVSQPGSKATAATFTMKLSDYHKLFIGRLPQSGNENQIRQVLSRACDLLNKLYPDVISEYTTYAGATNHAKYQAPLEDKAKEELISTKSLNNSEFVPVGCELLAYTRLTDQGRSLLETMLNRPYSSRDTALLAEFQSRLTYLSFPNFFESHAASNSQEYLTKMLVELGHLSIVSASSATFLLRFHKSKLNQAGRDSIGNFIARLANFKLTVRLNLDGSCATVTGNFKQFYTFVLHSKSQSHRHTYEEWLLRVVQIKLSEQLPMLFPPPHYSSVDLPVTLSKLKEVIPWANIIGVYRYGSQNYGTAHVNSDTDYNVVVYEDIFDGHIMDVAGININIYSQAHFAKALQEHNIGVLESFNHPMFERQRPELEFNPNILRGVIDHIVWYSLQKAEKCLLGTERRAEDRAYVAKKNIFHAYRIAACAIELCQNNGIVLDWTRWKDSYNGIMKLPNDLTRENWNLLIGIWKPKIDALMDEFHLLVPTRAKTENKQHLKRSKLQ